MEILVVSSPGATAAAHWSKAAAGAFCRLAAARGGGVRWFVALHGDEESPAGGDGVQVVSFRERREHALHDVAASQRDPALERALTESARAAPGCAVVHFGLGAQGSPNLLWLAERLGSRVFAVARGAELVCHRGDLLDREQRPCRAWDDAERCRWCCARPGWSWRARPRADDLRNRADLLVASLHVCEAVLVEAEADARLVAALGVPAKRVTVGADVAATVDLVCGGAPAA